ncbi:S49 family peptidase [Pseudomonas huanghezhanensis]|uniref:S49 family peptidase n=1 Tax=Pseudomonas huanghezhanensis TaxID=3002903 RepID=UPI002286BD8A|nr:S49 family peptidase [Pseudomonas sp. BSw22131]
MRNAFDMASSQPWLMLPSALDNLLAISDRLGDPAALEARLGQKLDNTRSVVIRSGVAIVPVTGPIFRYANLLTEISGATSTQILATDIRQALDNPAVKAIVLDIDSPGGVASGINELADMIYAGRLQKRIVAYVGGTGASAAYWIASAANEVVVDDTAILGSIGVVVEVTVSGDKAGSKSYEIVSRNAPNKRPDLSSEQGRAKVGETVDAMASVFEAKVARNLGVSPSRVPAMGGNGGLLVGAAAVKAGLAHRLGSLEGVISELSAKSSSAQLPPKTKPAPFVPGKQSVRALNSPLKVVAQSAEQIRIAGIMALVAPGSGFDSVVHAAVTDGLTIEAAALQLFEAGQAHEKSIRLAAAATVKAPIDRPQQYSTSAIWRSRRSPHN